MVDLPMSYGSNFVLVVTITNRPLFCYRLEGDTILIGRGRNNHVRLEEEAVSKIHCELSRDQETGLWQFRDLESTNGSRLNGDLVSSDYVPVHAGDEILLGKVVRLYCLPLKEMEVPEPVEEIEDDPDINPVAAAVARQVREDMESTRLIKLPNPKRPIIGH